MTDLALRSSFLACQSWWLLIRNMKGVFAVEALVRLPLIAHASSPILTSGVASDGHLMVNADLMIDQSAKQYIHLHRNWH